MKKINIVILSITLLLFIIPFFWLKPGFVDLGGDAGRLYLLDPLASALNLYKNQNVTGATLYSMVSYEFFLYLIKTIVVSPTLMSAFDHGLQLALGFISVYVLVKKLIELTEHPKNGWHLSWIAMVSALVYVGLITKLGWTAAMQTQNQIFLNPLIFYLLLCFMDSGTIFSAYAVLIITFLYAGNFGFTSMPQLASFFPLALLFLFGLFRYVWHRSFPWKKLVFVGVWFAGLHAYHIIPSLAAVLDTGSITHGTIFSGTSIQNLGVHYFDANHGALGQVSIQLFGSWIWKQQNALALLVPFIMFLGFLVRRSKLLTLIGVFFAVTFFLVTANITSIGIQFYRMLFYIPGFMMFRSFDEKWYFVYSFFYALLFGASFYYIFVKKYRIIAFLVGICVIASIGYRIYPFIQGNSVNASHWQTEELSGVFMMDPDLTKSIDYVKHMPDDGKVLTLPLTSSYNQIAYGKQGGVYSGISMVQNIGGKKDFAGFWTFGSYQEDVFNTLREENTHNLLQLFSLLNIRYVFYNSDSRIMDNFPGFPYVYPGFLVSSKDQIPATKNQQAYRKLLSTFPAKEIFSKGFYHIYEFDSGIVRPTVYIPDVLYSSQSGALSDASFRSAFGDEAACNTLTSLTLQCNGHPIGGTLPSVSFTKVSETKYDVRFDLKGRKEPFLVVLSENYHPSWDMSFQGNNKVRVTHIYVNGYANGWIIDPRKTNDRILNGSIRLGFQRYYTYGWSITGVTAILLAVSAIWYGLRRKYEKK